MDEQGDREEDQDSADWDVKPESSAFATGVLVVTLVLVAFVLWFAIFFEFELPGG